MRHGVLGPLEVRDDSGAPVPLGSPKLRALLSLLLGAFVLGGSPEFTIQTQPAPGQVWL